MDVSVADLRGSGAGIRTRFGDIQRCRCGVTTVPSRVGRLDSVEHPVRVLAGFTPVVGWVNPEVELTTRRPPVDRGWWVSVGNAAENEGRRHVDGDVRSLRHDNRRSADELVGGFLINGSGNGKRIGSTINFLDVVSHILKCLRSRPAAKDRIQQCYIRRWSNKNIMLY